MSYRVLSVIEEAFSDMGINYAFQLWKDKADYPYWVSDYQESENINEDGLQETMVYITGFARDSASMLEFQKDKIQNFFKHGKRVITADGYAVVIFYASTNSNIPTGEKELFKIQIDLRCIESAPI